MRQQTQRIILFIELNLQFFNPLFAHLAIVCVYRKNSFDLLILKFAPISAKCVSVCVHNYAIEPSEKREFNERSAQLVKIQTNTHTHTNTLKNVCVCVVCSALVPSKVMRHACCCYCSKIISWSIWRRNFQLFSGAEKSGWIGLFIHSPGIAWEWAEKWVGEAMYARRCVSRSKLTLNARKYQCETPVFSRLVI